MHTTTSAPRSRSRIVLVLARATTALALCALLGSCAFLGSITCYDARPTPTHVRGVRTGVPSNVVKLAVAGVVLGGRPAALFIDRGGRKLRLQSRDVSWDQDLIGPLVPLFPVLMAAGTRRPCVEFELYVVDGELELAPDDVRIVDPSRAELLRPSRWECVHELEPNRNTSALPPSEPLVLRRGDCAWLQYELSTLTPQFDVSIAPALFGAARGAEHDPDASADAGEDATELDASARTFTFERDEATFLTLGIPIGPQ